MHNGPLHFDPIAASIRLKSDGSLSGQRPSHLVSQPVAAVGFRRHRFYTSTLTTSNDKMDLCYGMSARRPDRVAGRV